MTLGGRSPTFTLLHGRSIQKSGPKALVGYCGRNVPQWPALAELLRLGSPRVPVGDLEVDRKYGFATPDPDRFRPWMAQPENKKAMLSLLSMMPRSRRQRCRVKVAGILELNMPEYLYFKMQPAEVKALLEELDSFAGKLEHPKG